MKNKSRIISSAVLLAGLIVMPGVSFACSCGERDLKEIIDSSKHIFVAEIVAVAKNPDSDQPLNSVTANFEIRSVIKGAPSKLTGLSSGYGGGDCGFPFLVGHRLLVFTSDGAVSMCGATRSLPVFDDEKEYISLLTSYIENGVAFDFDKYSATAGVWIKCDE